jgi:hypothetical protein
VHVKDLGLTFCVSVKKKIHLPGFTKLCKKMWFLFGEGEGFHKVFGDGQTKWPIAKKEKKESPIQAFVLWDAPQ